MKSDLRSSDKAIDKTLDRLYGQKKNNMAALIAILLIYFASSFIVNQASRSQDVIYIGEKILPISSFAGVLTSLSNICLISLVIFFKKQGFIASMLLLLIQFPILVNTLLHQQRLTSIAGLFTNLFTIIAIIVIYLNDRKADSFLKRLREEAVTDRLTGLPNRFACTELMEELAKREEKFAVISVDLNGFKSINDTMGHSTGNEVLKEIAERWKASADEKSSGTLDFITRQSGDEFAIIVRRFGSEEDILAAIRHYESVLEKKMTIDECDYFITASFGYAIYPTDTNNSETLLSYADAAVHEIKRVNSGNHICRFTPELLRAEHQFQIERKIRTALESGSMYFHLQPQYDLSHRLRGFEALARMKDSDGTPISPGEFIPVAEQVGLIDKVDLSVFRSSAMFFGELLKKTDEKITLSVNVSVKHLMKNGFLEEVREILDSSGVPPENLEIEITESVMIDSADKAIQCIKDIHGMGIKIAIDDFGTGYSSLSYLNSFPASLLKIDKSFIDKMNSSESSRQYVAAIVSIGHIMNFEVISEGVEEPDQLETLRSIGCDFIQGFIWGKPLPPEEAEKLVLNA